MENNSNMNDELCEKIKKHMEKLSTEEIMEWRNKLLEIGQIDNQLLALFNAELLDRACKRIEIRNSKSK